MAKFRIQGGTSLQGEVAIGGAKNAALKMMAAALLTSDPVTLHNVPVIRDIDTMAEILRGLGASVERTGHQLQITARELRSAEPDYQLVKHLRGSVVLVGPLLARSGNIRLPQPGGCLIGARPIDTHTQALAQLGVEVAQEKDYYTFTADGLTGGRVVLREMSVTATENVMMAAVLAEGETEIRLAASEPEIEDLAVMLNTMGAKVSGAGTSVIRIQGVRALHGTEHTVLPDRIEAGTFAIAAAVSRGDVRIKNINVDHLDVVLEKLRAANVNFSVEDKTTLHVKPTTMFNPVQIDTRPYPGFPTDLQAPFSVLLTQANGSSSIFETLYEGRLGYVRELEKMGAQAAILDTHTVHISGPTPLYGKEITSFDLRAGATLILAALIATGESIIDRVELVDRGYERIDERLVALGAHITRVE